MRPARFALALVLLVPVVLLPDGANGQLVRAYVTPDSLAVGRRATLVVVAEHAPGDTIVFPSLRPNPGQAGAALGELVVLDLLGRGRKLLGPGYSAPLADTMSWEVTTFALDSAFVPQVQVEYRNASGVVRLRSDPFFVLVGSVVPPDATTLRDITPIAPFRARLWPYVLGLLLLVAAVMGIRRWMLNRPVPEPEPVEDAPPPVIESPIAEAMRRLGELEHVDLDVPDSQHPFFVELADTLRTYLERRLAIPALEQTTAELDRSLQPLVADESLPAGIPTYIRSMLEQCDLAKFAKYRYPSAQSRSILVETGVLLMQNEDRYRPRRAAEAVAETATDPGDPDHPGGDADDHVDQPVPDAATADRPSLDTR